MNQPTNWLDDLVNQRKELESPLSFWRWAGLTAIAAVIKDNVWLDRVGVYNLYPNIYVMFHAESGLKKGPPVALAGKLVSAVNNTKVIGGRSSIQGILKELGTAKTIPGGKVIHDSSAFICSSELTSSIVEDKVATTILTDLYDRQYRVGEWRSLLKMETFSLKNPTINILTATNDAHSQDFFAKKDIQGGYFARTFIIYENKPNRRNSLLVPLENPINDIKLIEYLKILSKLGGKFQDLGSKEESDIHKIKYRDRDTGKIVFFTEAGAVYQEWYDDFYESIHTQEFKDETGTLNRFGDSVLKVAMLLSLSKRPELIIDPQAMEEAIVLCERLVGNIRKTTLGSKGMASNAALKAAVIQELVARENHTVSRTVLMKKNWMHYSVPKEFDELMLSFQDAGLVDIRTIGNQIIYVMPESQANELKQFFAGKVRK